MDSHPPARRPHKSPAHTVKDRGLRPQRLVRSPPHQSARGSRTSYSEFQGRQHLTAPFLTAVPALRSVPQDVPISGARIVHSHASIGKRKWEKNFSWQRRSRSWPRAWSRSEAHASHACVL